MDGSGLTPEQHWLKYGRYPWLLAKVVLWLLIGTGILFALRSIENVLFPVFFAMLLAYLLDPAVDWFEARGFSRTTGIASFLAIGGAGIALVVLFVYPTVAHILNRIVDGIPKLVDLFETQALPFVREQLGVEVPDNLRAILQEYGDTLKNALPSLARTLTGAASDLLSRTGSIAGTVVDAVLVPVLTFYFLRDFDKMRLAAVDYLPTHNRTWLLDRVAKMDEVVGAWFRGQVEVAAVLAVLYALGLGLTFGISGIGFTSGVAIGLLAGLLNVIPYFGFFVGFVMATLLTLLDWTGWGPLIGVVATFAIVQALEGYVVTPRVVGEKVGLSPVVVIIALLLGGELLGPLGVVLALPLAGIFRVLLPDLVAWYRDSDLYTGVLRRTDAEALVVAGAPGGVQREEGGARDAGGPERSGGLGAPGERVPGPPAQGDGGGRVPDGAVAGSEPDVPRAADEEQRPVEGGQGAPQAGDGGPDERRDLG